jgi:hypothetical protein
MSMKLAFPLLESEGFAETSPASPDYKCIAWTAGRTDVAWWPDPQGVGYWPPSAPRSETLEAFCRAFESIGYAPCADGAPESGFEKIALYAQEGRPKHAARQLADGSWTSKLGKHIDITHTLRGVEGPVYGQVHSFVKRARQGT